MHNTTALSVNHVLVHLYFHILCIVSLCHVVREEPLFYTYCPDLFGSASLRRVLLLVDSELRTALAPLALWDNIHNSWNMESAAEPRSFGYTRVS
jgi:hypothetical protein